MAPNTATAVTVDLDVISSVADALHLPEKTPQQITEDLLSRLGSVKRRREALGLNHWEEFAPGYLQQLAERHERLRLRAIEVFFRVHRGKALALARYWLGDPMEAEDAVAEAFLRLLSGKTGPSHFYRILRLICVDLLRAKGSAAKVVSRRLDIPVRGEDEAAFEPVCGEIAGGDPLEVLIRQEEIREGIGIVKKDWRRRWITQNDWWQELVSHHEPQLNVGKRPAQTNM